MPSDEPARAGFTNTGRPSAPTRASASSRSRAQSRSVMTAYGACARPALANSAFMTPLSIAAAEASTPLPT